MGCISTSEPGRRSALWEGLAPGSRPWPWPCSGWLNRLQGASSLTGWTSRPSACLTCATSLMRRSGSAGKDLHEGRNLGSGGEASGRAGRQRRKLLSGTETADQPEQSSATGLQDHPIGRGDSVHRC
ncbi:hypothetical protein FQN60_013972 [Etheostoma spectabile]|uniref:Uncharacterized protein n=1 Tax=Etheostoma spectabile TaxID=54343 RepID=A0A5J5CDC2_9PERO|nr:hypothetical protein FQN60_013972 [Etheostoma spectabile]